METRWRTFTGGDRLLGLLQVDPSKGSQDEATIRRQCALAMKHGGLGLTNHGAFADVSRIRTLLAVLKDAVEGSPNDLALPEIEDVLGRLIARRAWLWTPSSTSSSTTYGR